MEDDFITAEAENENNKVVLERSGSKRKGIEKYHQEDEEKNQDDDDGEKSGGGGIIASIISNLVSPLSTSPKDSESKKGKFDLFEDDDDDNNKELPVVKIIGQVVDGTGGDQEVVKINGHDDGGGGDGSGSGGLIESIVSHIPTSLPDDAAPSPDEASLLIHAIIHD